MKMANEHGTAAIIRGRVEKEAVPALSSPMMGRVDSSMWLPRMASDPVRSNDAAGSGKGKYERA